MQYCKFALSLEFVHRLQLHVSQLLRVFMCTTTLQVYDCNEINEKWKGMFTYD